MFEVTMRRLLVPLAMLALAAPPAAHAGTATTADGRLRFTANAGEVNTLTVQRVSGNTFRLTDTGAVIVAGTGCTQESPNVVTCTPPGGPIIANLGDQNDRATSRTSRGVQFFGEDGNDRLAGASGRDTIDGGNGDDNLTGGSGRDRIRGRGGNDQLFGNSGNDGLSGDDGNDLIDGGSGNDTESGGNGDDTLRESNSPNGADVLSGDSGNDTADYCARPAPVNVTMDNFANAGDRRTNEGDNVRITIDRVLGSAASDTLIGRDGLADTLVGGTGDDVIDPLRGNDHVDGGPGIDQISLRDLSSDDVICGDGVDSVAADERDTTAPDCEKVRRTAAMSIALAESAAYPTVMVRVVCPRSAFKACGGRVIIRSLGKLPTRSGKKTLTLGVKRISLPAGSERIFGVRIRSGAKPYLGRRGLLVRATLSAFDGAGPARKDAIRFRLGV
jgi:Ca2+-binding RTX toxin-like protein